MKKLLLLIPATVLLWAAPASAHTPTVYVDCHVLEITLVAYEPNSTVTVVVDGQSTTTKFSGDFHKAIPWDAASSHKVTVTVDNRGDGMGRDEWDVTIERTTEPCVAPTTTSSIPSIAPPTTIPVVPLATVPVMNPPVVLDRAPTVTPPVQPEVVLAFTGVELYQKFILAALLVGAGVWMTHTARAMRKEAEPLP